MGVAVGDGLRFAGIVLLACLTLSLALSILVAGPWMAWKFLGLDGLLSSSLFVIELAVAALIGVDRFSNGGEK